jgi:hypothetical protein
MDYHYQLQSGLSSMTYLNGGWTAPGHFLVSHRRRQRHPQRFQTHTRHRLLPLPPPLVLMRRCVPLSQTRKAPRQHLSAEQLATLEKDAVVSGKTLETDQQSLGLVWQLVRYFLQPPGAEGLYGVFDYCHSQEQSSPPPQQQWYPTVPLSSQYLVLERHEHKADGGTPCWFP